MATPPGGERPRRFACDDCLFEDNAGTNGGALFVNAAGAATCDCCSFVGNDAMNGGAVFGNVDATVALTAAVFTSNEASAAGGDCYGVVPACDDAAVTGGTDACAPTRGAGSDDGDDGDDDDDDYDGECYEGCATCDGPGWLDCDACQPGITKVFLEDEGHTQCRISDITGK